jgi:hypothetical protein
MQLEMEMEMEMKLEKESDLKQPCQVDPSKKEYLGSVNFHFPLATRFPSQHLDFRLDPTLVPEQE